jgi:hypothetical protein
MHQTALTMIKITANPPITPPTIPPVGVELGTALAVGPIEVELLELVADTDVELPTIVAVGVSE